MTHSLDAITGKHIGFVGAGNMAQAIIRGLVASGFPADAIFASAKSDLSRANIESKLGVKCASNAEIAAQCDVIVLAVKPQILRSACEELAATLNKKALIISVAAGIQCSAIATWLGERAIVRCMPNTPSAIGEGASGLFANKNVSAEQKHIAHTILSAVGIAEFVEEEALLDAITAIAGSAPAYFFLFLEAMIDSGKALGLPAELAEQFAIQTAVGASKLAQSSHASIPELRKMVTSPNGTTERAIASFEKNKQRDIVDQAMKACVNRAQELSKALSSNT